MQLKIIGQGDDEQRGEHKRDCIQCVNWFLGCLNGREKWKDEAVRPNFRETPDGRTLCDAFEWDPNPERQGRVVMP